jgi:hypothetical protein
VKRIYVKNLKMDADEDKIGEEAGVGNVKGVNFLQYPE